MVTWQVSMPIVVERLVGEIRRAVTDGKVWLLDGVFTVTSKWPGVVDTTWTVADSDVVSVCIVMARSYLSPPNRRDGREVQGVGSPTLGS